MGIASHTMNCVAGCVYYGEESRFVAQRVLVMLAACRYLVSASIEVKG